MTDPVRLLAEAVEAQRFRMRGYEIESEAITFETLRALDYLYCQPLFPELPRPVGTERQLNHVRRESVNAALSRVLPKSLSTESTLSCSTKKSADKVDNFLVDAGTLSLSEHQLKLVHAGILRAHLEPRKAMGKSLVILSVADPNAYREQVGSFGLKWLGEQAEKHDRPLKNALERRHREVLPLIVRHTTRGVPPDELPFDKCDEYFHDWAIYYLRGMAFRDLLADDDVLGGRAYRDYVSILTALSAISQQRLCYAGLLNASQPSIGIRNLLTGGAVHDELVEALSYFLDAQTTDVSDLLEHLTLSPKNRDVHLTRGTPAFAPVVRTSKTLCALPNYGLETNPFVFLNNELRARYENDWFEAANRREARWVAQLCRLFPPTQWTCADGIKLKRGSKVVTDIDFAAFEHDTRELLLFQLKWQQPFVGDERVRRSNAGNLLDASNRWVSDVYDWIREYGLEAVGRRLGLKQSATSFRVVVLARYYAHFGGRTPRMKERYGRTGPTSCNKESSGQELRRSNCLTS